MDTSVLDENTVNESSVVTFSIDSAIMQDCKWLGYKHCSQGLNVVHFMDLFGNATTSACHSHIYNLCLVQVNLMNSV